MRWSLPATGACLAVAGVCSALAGCCGLDVEYRRVEYRAKGLPDVRGLEQREDSLQVFFSSPVDLGRTAESSGLACTMRFPELVDVRGDGDVLRDLSMPEWAERLPHLPGKPHEYHYVADLTFMQFDLGGAFVELRAAIEGRSFAAAEVTI